MFKGQDQGNVYRCSFSHLLSTLYACYKTSWDFFIIYFLSIDTFWRQERFQYGNYNQYYGYRNPGKTISLYDFNVCWFVYPLSKLRIMFLTLAFKYEIGWKSVFRPGRWHEAEIFQRWMVQRQTSSRHWLQYRSGNLLRRLRW